MSLQHDSFVIPTNNQTHKYGYRLVMWVKFRNIIHKDFFICNKWQGFLTMCLVITIEFAYHCSNDLTPAALQRLPAEAWTALRRCHAGLEVALGVPDPGTVELRRDPIRAAGEGGPRDGAPGIWPH